MGGDGHMNFLSAIGAVYLGIYLILPGCLCQLLGAFGVETVEGRSGPRTCEVRGSDGVSVCHCNEHEFKKAEALAAAEFQDHEPIQFDEPLAEFAPPSPSASLLHAPGSRAPPTPPNPWSSRTFSGVFLI